MKSLKILFLTIAAIGLTLVACSKKGGIDTSALENSFKSADVLVQGVADKAVVAVKSADYSNALFQLQNLAKEAKLTPEQQQAVKDVLTQVQQVVSDAMAKAAAAATKTAEDATKSIPALPK